MEDSQTMRFGRYEIMEELGRGAMGVVYKARDPQIDRIVAVKTVCLRGQEPDAEQEFRARFLNEAQAAGRLHHPGIVAVFDVGEEPETNDPFIVLEYVAGESLYRLLSREKKLPMPRALQLAEEVADALDYAHQQGVTHRDIKPGNILLTPEGHAKVADFGIAKLNLAQLTLPGKLLGTPAYMAPEQLAGVAADGRSDLFSLGVILYAMVAGHSPFQGDSATAVCFKVANREPVPASAFDLNLPRELDAVIARAMAKDPEMRYQRGAELAEDIRQLLARGQRGGTTTLRAPTTSRISAGGTAKSSSALHLARRPAIGLAYAVKTIRTAILKAPTRDIVLGVATILLLTILGLQSKLLVRTHTEKTAVTSAAQTDTAHVNANPAPQAAPTQPAEPTVSAPPATDASANSAQDMPAPDNPPAKAPKAVVHPASRPAKKEVVVALATVELSIHHQFKDAMLHVWIDDQPALTRPLHGGTQKKLVVFGGVRGSESETLKVPAGKHILRFEAQTSDQTVDLSRSITAEFVGGDDKTLQITLDKHNSMRLDWQ